MHYAWATEIKIVKTLPGSLSQEKSTSQIIIGFLQIFHLQFMFVHCTCGDHSIFKVLL